jgi:protein phosphatase
MRGILTRSLGYASDLPIDYKRAYIRPGDYLLLCTDGLSGVLSEAEILAEVGEGTTLKQTCRRLVKKAYKLGGADNVTIILAKPS